MQVSPNSVIPVSYSTTIPGDTTLYYVQAVLRDTQSSTILQILNLTNVSSTPNRYTGLFNPVSDPSGLGRPVDVTISVYTDSGHTALSPNYQIVQYNYVVLQPWIQNLGTGGGLNIDYEKLQKMFDGTKVTNTEIGNEKPVKLVRINYKRIEESVAGNAESSRYSISQELQKHVMSLTSLISDMQKLHSQSDAAHQGNFGVLQTRIDVLEALVSEGRNVSSTERSAMKKDLATAIRELREDHSKGIKQGSEQLDKKVKSAVEEIQEYLQDNLADTNFTVQYQPAQKKEKEKPMFSPDDIAALLR